MSNWIRMLLSAWTSKSIINPCTVLLTGSVWPALTSKLDQCGLQNTFDKYYTILNKMSYLSSWNKSLFFLFFSCLDYPWLVTRDMTVHCVLHATFNVNTELSVKNNLLCCFPTKPVRQERRDILWYWHWYCVTLWHYNL